ncbi:MAG: sulfatase-like hydrolase/transferase [Candidatus Omnitrophica bacterium]|nr:sulfatase-like hydrolase/transferase [Candidatus Omnitrophota bacterium]
MKHYLNIFRLIFVLFFLYLLGDAGYRWDAFKHYGSFYEFLISFSLITILWGVLSLAVTTVIWLIWKAIECFLARIGLNIKWEHLLIFAVNSVFIGVMLVIIKRFVWHSIVIEPYIRLLLVLGIFLVVTISTWLARNKAERLINAVLMRITLLVWLFGVIFLLSTPVAFYYAFKKNTDNVTAQTYPAGDTLPNIILVTFDALTARHMSLYGYHRETTPFIDEWAKDALLFTSAKSDGAYTTPRIFFRYKFKPA